MLSFSERGGWSFIKPTRKVQSRPILELKHSRVEDDYRLPFQSLQFDLRGVATSTSDLTIFACRSNWSVASSESGFNAAGLGARMRDVAVVSYCRTCIAKAGRGGLNQTNRLHIAAHL